MISICLCQVNLSHWFPAQHHRQLSEVQLPSLWTAKAPAREMQIVQEKSRGQALFTSPSFPITSHLALTLHSLCETNSAHAGAGHGR